MEDYDDLDESDMEEYLARGQRVLDELAPLRSANSFLAKALREMKELDQDSSVLSPEMMQRRARLQDLMQVGIETPQDESFDFSEIPRLQEALKALVETPSARERRESAARRAYAKKLAEDKRLADTATDQAGRLAELERKADAMQTATRVEKPYGGQEPLKPERSMLSSKDSKAMADEEDE